MYSIYAELRDRYGLSDYAVAKETGVGRSTLSDWKTGKHIPNRENMKKIADFFHVSMDYLMSGEIPSLNKPENSPVDKANQLYALYQNAPAEVQSMVDYLLKSSQ